jgi:hypothetical protein
MSRDMSHQNTKSPFQRPSSSRTPERERGACGRAAAGYDVASRTRLLCAISTGIPKKKNATPKPAPRSWMASGNSTPYSQDEPAKANAAVSHSSARSTRRVDSDAPKRPRTAILSQRRFTHPATDAPNAMNTHSLIESGARSLMRQAKTVASPRDTTMASASDAFGYRLRNRRPSSSARNLDPA